MVCLLKIKIKNFYTWNKVSNSKLLSTCHHASNSSNIMYYCFSILAGIKPISATDTLQVSIHTSQLQNNTSSMCTKQWRAEHTSRQMTPPHVCFRMGRYMWSLTYCIRWHQNTRVSLLIPDVLSDVNRPQGRLFLLGIPPTIRHLSLPLKSPRLTHARPELQHTPLTARFNKLFRLFQPLATYFCWVFKIESFFSQII